MGNLSVSRRTLLRARKALKEGVLANLYAAYEELSLRGGIKTLRLDAADDSLYSSAMSLADVRKEIERLESEIDRIDRQLANSGLVNVRVRRFG